MSKTTITIGLIAMIIINVTLISIIVIHNSQDNKRSGPTPHLLVRELDFNDDQILKFEKLKESHFSNVEPKMAKVRELKRSLMNTTKKEIARNLTTEIGKLEGEIDYLTFEHFSEIEEMCNNEQKQELDEIKKRMSERMSDKHHRDRRGRPIQ
jgi:hypothetical protein